MGFWNGKADGPLDKMFDFNRDGKLNAWERAMELGLLMDDEDDYQDEDDEFDEDMDLSLIHIYTINSSDYTIKIPMSHGVDSLNVAAASAVAFWELGK